MTIRAVTVASVSVVTALVGAALGSWIAWFAAGPLPSDQEALAVARAAAPGRDFQVVSRADYVFDYDYPATSAEERLFDAVLGSDDYESGHVDVRWAEPADAGRFVAELGDGLRSDGWEVAVDEDEDALALTARRGPLTIVGGTGSHDRSARRRNSRLDPSL